MGLRDWGWEVGCRRTGNLGTSANSSSRAESSWRLKESTEETGSIGVGSQLQILLKRTTFLEDTDYDPVEL